jgi:hypothetical protein
MQTLALAMTAGHGECSYVIATSAVQQRSEFHLLSSFVQADLGFHFSRVQNVDSGTSLVDRFDSPASLGYALDPVIDVVRITIAD